MRVHVKRHLVAVILALSVVLGVSSPPAKAAVEYQPGPVVQTVQYYGGHYGPRRFYHRPYYGPRPSYGPGPRYFGRPYYGHYRGRPFYGHHYYRRGYYR
jgi:hypothetical protein